MTTTVSCSLKSKPEQEDHTMQQQGCASRDRRRDRRYPLAGTLSWCRSHDADMLTGWSSDTSRSSLSFVTARRNEPAFGEIIEMSGSGRPSQVFRVTRTAPYDDRLSLVACCVASRQDPHARRTGKDLSDW
jgi:hypothetical protein